MEDSPFTLPRVRRGFPAHRSFQLPEDGFTIKFSGLLSAKKFHALGVLSFVWNSLSARTEWLHDVLYRSTTGHKPGASSKMNGRTLTDRTRVAPTLQSFPEYLRHAITVYADATDICRDNRNALLHAAMTLEPGMYVNTGSRNDLQGQVVTVKVGEIRRVCHDISDAVSFSNDVILAAPYVQTRWNRDE